jgi:hypothetical protein
MAEKYRSFLLKILTTEKPSTEISRSAGGLRLHFRHKKSLTSTRIHYKTPLLPVRVASQGRHDLARGPDRAGGSSTEKIFA